MNVLVIGSGGREHALAARCAAEVGPASVLAAPGNPGIARVARLIDVDPLSAEAVLALVDRERVDLTIVGPELPLSVGLVDRFHAAGRAIVGPTRAAAGLETSKAFAKAFMHRHGVPTARFLTCHTHREALDMAKSAILGFPLVIKADGLAAGKGVVIASEMESAERAIREAMVEQRFGSAGARVVLEECLTGPEVSFFALCDGIRALTLGTAQDHKRIFDNDEGPNTGGMGAFAPSRLVTAGLHDRIVREIVCPVLAGMSAEGHPFSGFLYVGLMLTPDGPKVIEFNVRLGDPEAQVILSLVDEPLLPLLMAAAEGRLRAAPVRLAAETRVGVVLASRGYPERSDVGRVILGLEAAARLSNVSVFHAGTSLREGHIVTAGGRVLTVVGGARTYDEAIRRAYEGVDLVSFDGMQYRRDIGRKALLAGERAAQPS
ncbi:MAG: phosphoribosylamine--glycine ligase [Acidimicrobiia bacterium]|nr:phosphoribosylamine--glycine ligase [Acidimicrobiia bacterium]